MYSNPVEPVETNQQVRAVHALETMDLQLHAVNKALAGRDLDRLELEIQETGEDYAGDPTFKISLEGWARDLNELAIQLDRASQAVREQWVKSKPRWLRETNGTKSK